MSEILPTWRGGGGFTKKWEFTVSIVSSVFLSCYFFCRCVEHVNLCLPPPSWVGSLLPLLFPSRGVFTPFDNGENPFLAFFPGSGVGWGGDGVGEGRGRWYTVYNDTVGALFWTLVLNFHPKYYIRSLQITKSPY